ncbi:K02A2.6-like [Cordylochernes scorpioides]|uniref:RNA-directed DNA polymerase n=1 Tax=Cordylochernes scorpioides TaxID=51811 RepID=A0ABY6LTM0_9ARAC|nr:K02A2.6-like [Cordylochernes scorpioides]
MIRDQIIEKCYNRQLKEKLLQQDNLNLQRTIEISRMFETAKEEFRVLTNEYMTSINRVNYKNNFQAANESTVKGPKAHNVYHQKGSTSKVSAPNLEECYRCGLTTHPPYKCGARNMKCTFCNKMGHLNRVCRNKNKYKNIEGKKRNIQNISENNEDSDKYTFFLGSDNKESIYIDGKEITMTIDTGSDTTFIGLENLKNIFPKSQMPTLNGTERKFYAYGQTSPLPCCGYFFADVSWGERSIKEQIFVIEGKAEPLLGKKASFELEIIKRGTKIRNIQEEVIPKDICNLIQENMNLFQGQGNVKGYSQKITLKENVTPVAQRCRHFPYKMVVAINQELDKMIEDGIIEEVHEASKWISNIVAVPKKGTEEIRLCVDLKEVMEHNQAYKERMKKYADSKNKALPHDFKKDFNKGIDLNTTLIKTPEIRMELPSTSRYLPEQEATLEDIVPEEQIAISDMDCLYPNESPNENENKTVITRKSLRDRFVAGIIDTSTQKKLLQEEKLTFDGALDIALSAESADNDLHNIKGSENAHQSPQHLHAINNTCKHCGPIKGIKCHLDVKADFIPKFYKFRQVPFALKQLVENEIDTLVDLNILSPIDKSDCASPLVCVAKPNGQIRLCADFKKSLNPYLEDVKYPIPNIDSVLSNFLGKKLFTKLDLSKAYHQIEMDDISKKYLVVSTHKDRSFNSCKNALDETTCLSHYSLNLPLILSCYASQVGIGATLSHLKDGEERPVCFISRTLNVHERKYSQVEREGLSIVFAVNKLKNYLFGRKFTIYTDHKPLITIFGDKTNLPPLIANRLHRWALTLSNFSFEIKYKKGKDNIIPDFLSRFPDFQESNLEYSDGSGEIFLLNTSIIDHVLVAHETHLDRTLFKLYKIIETGELPSSPNDDLIPYLKRIDDFTILQKCIFLENRMVIPKSLHEKVLQLLHESHAGTNKMKMMARSSIWWPGMDSSIEIITKNCRTCLSNESLPPQRTESWPKYAGPWRRVHMDYFNFKNKLFLLAVDSFSSWVEVSEVPSTSAYFCINFMRNCIARYGFPQVVVSDNGPPFFSSDFGDFLSKNGISHVTSPPYHPKSNGQAEVSVREVKKLLKKQLYENEQVELDLALSRALFFIRTDVNIRKGTSPAELFLGRKIRSRLSVLSKEEVKVSKVNGQYVNSKFKVDETAIRPYLRPENCSSKAKKRSRNQWPLKEGYRHCPKPVPRALSGPP